MQKNLLFFYPEMKEGQRRVTVAGIVNEAKHTLTIGKSECSPLDQFNKKAGRAVALKNANTETKRIAVLPLAENPINQFIEFAKQF